MDDDMIVIFREHKVTLKEAIINCKPGEPIEGIHPSHYDKLVSIFEQNRNKKFQYSVDMKYGNWRFILFDINKPIKTNKSPYINRKYLTDVSFNAVNPIPNM